MPDVWVANPHRRVVLFEGRNTAGRDHVAGWSYTGKLWDNTAGRNGAVMHRLVGQVVAGLATSLTVVTDVWSVVCPTRGVIVAHGEVTGHPQAHSSHGVGTVGVCVLCLAGVEGVGGVVGRRVGRLRLCLGLEGSNVVWDASVWVSPPFARWWTILAGGQPAFACVGLVRCIHPTATLWCI